MKGIKYTTYMTFQEAVAKKVVDKNNAVKVHIEYHQSHGRTICFCSLDAIEEKAKILHFHLPTNTRLLSVSDYIPADAPTGSKDNPNLFFGVDRSMDTIRLSGVRHNPKEPMELHEKLHELLHLCAREGARIDYFVSRKHPGFLPLSVVDDKPIDTLVDETLETDDIFAIQLDTWVYYTNEKHKIFQLGCTNPGWNGRLIRD